MELVRSNGTETTPAFMFAVKYPRHSIDEVPVRDYDLSNKWHSLLLCTLLLSIEVCLGSSISFKLSFWEYFALDRILILIGVNEGNALKVEFFV